MTEIIITDVTRMSGTNVCVAGSIGGSAIRLDDPVPNEGTLQRVGGLSPGDVIDIAWKPTKGASPPHVEDGSWRPDSIRKLRSLDYGEFVRKLAENAYDQITDAFGDVYRKGAGGNFAFRPGIGKRSLASVRAKGVEVYLDFNKIGVRFVDRSGPWAKVALEDLTVRKHAVECAPCRRNLTRQLSRDFDAESAILRVGLSRPYQVPDHPLACWVQVNGIYPLDRKRQHFA